jgi:copper transport protein
MRRHVSLPAHRRQLTRPLLAALGVAGAIGLLFAPSALGHAAFLGSQPEPGVRLESSPQRIVLTFTEPLNRALSRATLVAADGQEVELTAQGAADRRLILRPKAGADAGAYRVRWHTVSTEDGHALEGSFSFGLRAPAAGGEHELEQSPLARSGWLRVALRGLFYVAVLLFAAGLLVPLLVRSRDGSWLAPAGLEDSSVDVSGVRVRERELVTDLGWLAVGFAAAVTLAEAADAANGVSLQGLTDFLLANASGAARVVSVVALLLAVLVARHRRWLAAAFVAIALAGVAASGHASSAEPRMLTVVNDWLHLMAGAAWLGGLGLLVLVWWPLLRRGGPAARQAAATHVLPAFGRVALPAFALVTTTGLVSLVVQLGQIDALWSTGYGQVLLVKISLVGLIATASAVHAWRLRPQLLDSQPSAAAERRHWQLVRSEPLIGGAVLAAVALLVAFPLPPRQLGEADQALAAQPACDPCPLPKPAADELPVADQAGSEVVAGWLRRSRTGLSGTVRVSDIFGQPSRSAIDVLGARQSSCGLGCRRFRLPAGPSVSVGVRDGGRRFVAELPARWHQGGSGRARLLLAFAQASMRRLGSVRETEAVTSGPGSYARTEYRFQAPDRMALKTNGGVQSVIAGERQWFRTRETPWERRSYGSGIAFSLRRWFRWTTYAHAVRLLDRRREAGRPVAELALMDPATPVWLRMVIDERTGRVLRERMVTKGHFMTSRYFGFGRRTRIEAPDVG